MAKKNGKKIREKVEQVKPKEEQHRLHPDTKKSIWGIVFLGLAIILVLAWIQKAGPAGQFLYSILDKLVGWGYFALPLSLLIVAWVFFTTGRQKIVTITLIGATTLVFSILGLIDIGWPDKGGYLGLVLGALKIPFGNVAATVINILIFFVAGLVTINSPIRFGWRPKWFDKAEREEEGEEEEVGEEEKEEQKKVEEEPVQKKEEKEIEIEEKSFSSLLPKLGKKTAAPNFKNYVAPPLDLLKSSIEKPTTGDLRGNANIIKRTLESFGIAVEMGEINIGPKVTRYTLKPAEGVKLSKITALNQDLALALAAHPIRIEAPIPGKSLVGIEVPNKSAAVVRLGSMMTYGEFQSVGPLGFVLGRDVTGEPIFGNIEKMPHLLIAGATGSGKSVMIHSLIVSLLYKNSPATLKLIMIDPKRVELSSYEGIPHLISPVITEAKKSVGVFRWAISEMDRRYELLQKAGSRDIKSYNSNSGKDDQLPYIVIIVDELADLMSQFGREVEGSIVRLAQMARATGIHLVLSTQRPSVEVITGLIKANITSRIALQVASQIDSRTILDTAGAEKLLGGGDLLFISSNLSKPKRIQGAFLSEEELHKVADFVRENNESISEGEEQVDFNKNGTQKNGKAEESGAGQGQAAGMFDDFMDGDDDDMYDEAVRVVGEAKKASASLLQRRLKVGYARAARLLDLMEERGIIGPGDGAKPREVYMEKIPLD